MSINFLHFCAKKKNFNFWLQNPHVDVKRWFFIFTNFCKKYLGPTPNFESVKSTRKPNPGSTTSVNIASRHSEKFWDIPESRNVTFKRLSRKFLLIKNQYFCIFRKYSSSAIYLQILSISTIRFYTLILAWKWDIWTFKLP